MKKFNIIGKCIPEQLTIKTFSTVGIYDRLHIGRLLLFKLVCLMFCMGCRSDDFTNDVEVVNSNDPEAIFNNNIRSIRQLLLHEENDGILSSIDSTDMSVYALYYMSQATPVVFRRNNQEDGFLWPRLSIKPNGSKYYWTLGDDFLLNKDGKMLLVTDARNTPSFAYSNGRWLLQEQPLPDSILSEVFLNISTYESKLTCISFPSTSQLTIPMESLHLPLVPQKAFYKDIFLDAGIGLTSRKSLYAAKYLGLSTEGISLPRSNASEEDILLQNEIIAGDANDNNGRLLYPDGQPRYKLLFVNGGDSRMHGQSLGSTARENMKKFVINGGSYVGTCAGAFFASNGYDGNPDYPYYLSLFPATMNHTGLSGTTTGMFIENESPLLDYYDFGGDYYVSDVRHNKGGYPVMLPTGTTILARFDYPQKSDVHMQPSVWSYKTDDTSGRLVLEASHPEEEKDGERRDLTAAMILYAMDGIGSTPLKGFLQNGKTRMMDCGSEANIPGHAKLGDLQCHHFAVMIPEGAENISVNVESQVEGDFSLSMSRITFAYPESADFLSANKGSHPSLSFSSLDSGLWFVCVQCLSSVEASQTDYGQTYSDPLSVLNGFPYQITASWQQQ